MAYKINLANIKDWAANYDGELFDGILCDPPYELGFMGKSWDSSGIAFDVEMWQNIYKLLKPGAHLLAFSGSRTYHRMAVAIEDAGFEIRDMIEWVYGSGFPKSLNIGKAVDKIQGNEREHIGEINDGRTGHNRGFKKDYVGNDGTGKQQYTQLTKGTSDWEGYGTALKPAHEPCVLARKPIDGTVANNCLKHGVGGLNIDGSRVGTEVITQNQYDRTPEHGNQYGNGAERKQNGIQTQTMGRFPANLIHDGSDEVEAVFPQNIKGQYGGKGRAANSKSGKYGWNNSKDNVNNKGATQGTADSGSASRFFYTAKASKSERNAGLDVPNTHPTLKPISLTKYLATLIKPPKGGRLLVPFSGSGSEMIGALQAGWEYVEGVELTEEYIPIAEARIKYWLEQMEKEQPRLFDV